ncbi:hypothetical protein F183_A00490 [Bryobacterales bacterium F-183]|nr:hypothetical protein F183_A00490 [Bryobacterales bacterium F-183]
MGSIDWAKALERIRTAEQNSGNTLDVQEIYKLRARRLAELPERTGLDSDAAAALDADRLELLIFRPQADGTVRYAVPARVVVEVLHAVRPTPVPGAPASVRGVIQVRGEIWPLFAIPDLATGNGAAPDMAILIRARGNRPLGILVADVEETRVVKRSSLRYGQSDHVMGILPDLTVVLQVESIGASGASGQK